VKNSRFTTSQIFVILTGGGAEILVAEVFRKHGISAPTSYQYKCIDYRNPRSVRLQACRGRHYIERLGIGFDAIRQR
jgi:hypothetical protein